MVGDQYHVGEQAKDLVARDRDLVVGDRYHVGEQAKDLVVEEQAKDLVVEEQTKDLVEGDQYHVRDRRDWHVPVFLRVLL